MAVDPFKFKRKLQGKQAWLLSSISNKSFISAIDRHEFDWNFSRSTETGDYLLTWNLVVSPEAPKTLNWKPPSLGNFASCSRKLVQNILKIWLKICLSFPHWLRTFFFSLHFKLLQQLLIGRLKFLLSFQTSSFWYDDYYVFFFFFNIGTIIQ